MTALRPLIFTLFRNARDISGQPIALSWEDWLQQYMSHHVVRGSPSDADDEVALKRHKNGPALVLGEMPAGSRHIDKAVLSVHALAVDVDERPVEEVARALTILEPFEYVAWTTHRHGAASAHGRPKLRVVLPLVEPLEPAQHARAWYGLNRLIGGINDPTTKNISRLHYLPSTFDPAVAEITRHRGRWLALEDLPGGELEVLAATNGQVRPEEMTKLRKKLRAEKGELKAVIRALLAGEIFENDPHQHDMVLKLTFQIAFLHQDLNDAEIQELFTPSLTVMHIADPTAPPMVDVVNAYNGAVKKILESEAQRKEQEKEKKRLQSLEEQAKGRKQYTKEDLERIASINGWKAEELQYRWILQKDGTCWFLSETGDYIGPFSRHDVPVGLSQVLSRAPVQLIEVTRDGSRYRSPTDVVREAGTGLSEIHSDMTLQRTYFDPIKKILHEAVRPIRKFDPVFNPEIDGWLKVLAGKCYTKLVDWMSCASDLNKLLCAIYFAGAPSSGKTLFATGMAKIWTEGSPGSIEKVLSNFNDEIIRCPLVLADEEVPHSYHNTATAALRSMLSTVERTLTRKYQPTSSLRGAVRLVLTSNSESLLNAEISSSQDLEAIAQRFLYIEVPREAADVLKKLPREMKEEWAQEGIAKHALWLADNHVVAEPGQRFWVEGNISEMTNRLLSDSKWNALVIEWLVRYLMNPKPIDSKCTELIRRGENDGELLVNDQAVVDGWSLYLSTKEQPITSFIGSALRAISKTSKRVKRSITVPGPDNKKIWIRYRVISVEHLLNWADRFNVGDSEVLEKAVSHKEFETRQRAQVEQTRAKVN